MVKFHPAQIGALKLDLGQGQVLKAQYRPWAQFQPLKITLKSRGLQFPSRC